MKKRIDEMKREGRMMEEKRIDKRKNLDMEMMEEKG